MVIIRFGMCMGLNNGMNLLNNEERILYFNNLLHIHQHIFLRYMMQSVIEGKNQKTNMSV